MLAIYVHHIITRDLSAWLGLRLRLYLIVVRPGFGVAVNGSVHRGGLVSVQRVKEFELR